MRARTVNAYLVANVLHGVVNARGLGLQPDHLAVRALAPSGVDVDVTWL